MSITLVVYAAVAVAALFALGPEQLAVAVDRLAQAVAVGSWSWMGAMEPPLTSEVRRGLPRRWGICLTRGRQVRTTLAE